MVTSLTETFPRVCVQVQSNGRCFVSLKGSFLSGAASERHKRGLTRDKLADFCFSCCLHHRRARPRPQPRPWLRPSGRGAALPPGGLLRGLVASGNALSAGGSLQCSSVDLGPVWRFSLSTNEERENWWQRANGHLAVGLLAACGGPGFALLWGWFRGFVLIVTAFLWKLALQGELMAGGLPAVIVHQPEVLALPQHSLTRVPCNAFISWCAGKRETDGVHVYIVNCCPGCRVKTIWKCC